MFTIRVNGVSAAMAGLERISPSRILTRLRSAVRATLRDGKSELKNRVTERYTAKSPMSLGKLKQRASALSGSLTISGRRNELKKFSITPRSRQNPQPAGGVFASVVQGQGGALSRAFVQRGGGVYERVGAGRFPIKQIKTIALPGMAKAVSTSVTARMEQRLARELDGVFV